MSERQGGSTVNIFRLVWLPLLILIVGGVLFTRSFRFVGGGEKGVEIRWSAVTGVVFDEGLHVVIPAMQNIEIMSVQTHAFQARAVESASHDLQTVHTDVTINYRLDAAKVAEIYRTLRRDYEVRILSPLTQETVKAVTARYVAEELITKRAEVRDAIEALLRMRVEQYGLQVETVSLTQFSFSDDFERAIEAKVTAEQQALKAKNDLERVKIEAQQQIERARAEAESIRIRSDALAQNQRLVEWEAIQKWDGKLPQITSGAVPFISVPLRQ